MTRTINLVQAVRIASPCTARWDEMAGDDRSRFCSHCNLNVYNLSAMTEEEGERLIIEKEGKLCARIYRRYDGTVLTKDCPVGLRAIRKRMVWLGMRAAAALAFIVSAAAYALAGRSDQQRHRGEFILGDVAPMRSPTAYTRTIDAMNRWLTVSPPQAGVWLAGSLAAPPPPPTKAQLKAVRNQMLQQLKAEQADARAAD